MRVLNCLSDGRFGGPPKRVLEVGTRLREDGVETIAVLPRGPGNAAEMLVAGGMSVRRLQMERIPYPRDVRRFARWVVRAWGDVRRFEALFGEEQPDLVHVNGAAFLPPAIASRRLGIPLVWHLNDTVVPRAVAGPLGFLVRTLADRIVVSAQAVADHYRVGRAAPQVVYVPVDVSRFAAQSGALESGECGQRDWRVGLIANWNPLKGHAHFIDAMAIARERIGTPLKLDLAGAKLDTQHGYAERIEAMIDARSVRDILVNHGFVNDVGAVLRRLDVLALASTSEACPIVVLEAMAAGVPVVGTDVGGVRELLIEGPEGDAGVVVPPANPAAMADAIVAMYKDRSGPRSLGRNGRFRAEHRFSLDSCALRHLAAYEGIVDPHARRQVTPAEDRAGQPADRC